MTRSAKFLAVLLALGLALMLGAAVQHRLTDPSLVKPAETRVQPEPAQADQAPPQDSRLAGLMRAMGERPDNPELLLETAVALIGQGALDEARTLLDRAALLDTASADIPYYQGYVAHRKNRHEEAAAFMEESLRRADRPDVRFSVGVLCAYFLNDKARAREHWEKGLSLPSATEEQKARFRTELERAAKP